MQILVLVMAVMVGGLPVMATAANGITDTVIASEPNGLALIRGYNRLTKLAGSIMVDTGVSEPVSLMTACRCMLWQKWSVEACDIPLLEGSGGAWMTGTVPVERYRF